MSEIAGSLPPSLTMGPVALRVVDVERSLGLYRDILGFRELERGVDGALLGTEDGRVLLDLREEPEAVARPRGTTGLYHVAILVPSRGDLGRLVTRLLEAGVPLGQSDHLVSQAIYLSDPDGNGLELYWDRPRDQWRWRDGQVTMAVDPLSLTDLVREGRTGQWNGLPEGTVVGHVHLNVGDLKAAEAFYHGVLGFDVVSKLPGALFVSAGGYHHHLGLNIWESPGGRSAPDNSVGLIHYSISLPTPEDVDAVRRRLASAGVDVESTDVGIAFVDPWGNRVAVVSG